MLTLQMKQATLQCYVHMLYSAQRIRPCPEEPQLWRAIARLPCVIAPDCRHRLVKNRPRKPQLLTIKCLALDTEKLLVFVLLIKAGKPSVHVRWQDITLVSLEALDRKFPLKFLNAERFAKTAKVTSLSMLHGTSSAEQPFMFREH